MSRDLNERGLTVPSIDHLNLSAGDPPLRYSHGDGKGGTLHAEEVLYNEEVSVLMKAWVDLKPLPPRTALR